MPNNSPWVHSDAPAETGPDYVALVIEWDDLAEDVTQVTPKTEGVPAMLKARLENVPAMVKARLEAVPAILKSRFVDLDVPALAKKVAIGAGALGALLFARWGIHRLRAA